MDHSLESLNTLKAYIVPIIFFGTNEFYLSSFLHDKNDKIEDNNKVLLFQLLFFSLFTITSIHKLPIGSQFGAQAQNV